MTRYLLDVNVLIALIDPASVHHDAAHQWFASTGRHAFATCPLTQNGVLRVVSHPRYPTSPGSPALVARSMAGLQSLAGHAFWADDISLHDTNKVNLERLLTSAQITDSYLLALAVAHGGKLASFDRRLVCDAVYGGKEALHLI